MKIHFSTMITMKIHFNWHLKVNQINVPDSN